MDNPRGSYNSDVKLAEPDKPFDGGEEKQDRQAGQGKAVFRKVSVDHVFLSMVEARVVLSTTHSQEEMFSTIRLTEDVFFGNSEPDCTSTRARCSQEVSYRVFCDETVDVGNFGGNMSIVDAYYVYNAQLYAEMARLHVNRSDFGPHNWAQELSWSSQLW